MRFSLSWRLCAIALAIGIAGCAAPPPPPVAGHPLTSDSPAFLRLPNLDANQTPVRVGVILPLNAGPPAARALAAAMVKAAELALFDSKNPNIILITADEGATPDDAAAAASRLLAQGAEVIIGPLFGPSVAAVAP